MLEKQKETWRKRWGRLQYLEAAGPGVITGAADDDPSGIGTYTMAGARFGTSFLWMALFTWPLMAAVQLACARVGMVTGEGLAHAFARRMPRPLLLLAVALLFVANTLNVAADLSAMGDASRILMGGHAAFFVVFYALAITAATIFLRYDQIAKVLKWLALFLFAYVIAAFTQRPDWVATVRAALVPSVPAGGEGWGMVLAILGTTISPYLFFWQTSQEVEEVKAKGRLADVRQHGATSREFRIRRIDVGLGTFFSNLVMFFIILTASLTLHAHGVTKVETTADAARALAPFAGRFASLLYTLGILGTGLLAIPTLTGSAAYALADTFHWRQGLDEKWRRARSFYLVILLSTVAAVVLDGIGFNPIQALYWSAIANGALAPFLLVVLCRVIGDTKLMNQQKAPRIVRATVAFTAALMFVALGFLVFA